MPKEKHDSYDESSFPIGAAAHYRQVRELAHGVKAGDATSIGFAAKLMASTVRDMALDHEGAVLVPVPGHEGTAGYTRDLAERIGRLTALPVLDLLISDRHEPLYNVKKEQHSVDGVPLKMMRKHDLPRGMYPILIDNVADTGKTATEAFRALESDQTRLAVLGETGKFHQEHTSVYPRFHFHEGEATMLMHDAYPGPGDRLLIGDEHHTVIGMDVGRGEMTTVGSEGQIRSWDTREMDASLVTLSIPRLHREQEKLKEIQEPLEYAYTLLCRPFGIGTHPEKGLIRHEKGGERYGRLIYDRRLKEAERKIFQLRPDTEMQQMVGTGYDYHSARGTLSMRIDGIDATDRSSFLVTLTDRDGTQKKAQLPYSDVMKKTSSGRWRKQESQPLNMEEITMAKKEKQETVRQQQTVQPKAEPKAEEKTAKVKANKEERSVSAQYQDLKKKHPDAILLIRTQHGYATQGKDALDVARVTGLPVEKARGKTAEKVSFPAYQLDAILPKLIRAGHRVAIAEQLQAKEDKKETVKSAPKEETKTKEKKSEKQPEAKEKKPETKEMKAEGSEKEPKKAQLITANGERVHHAHVFQSNKDPEKYYFIAHIDDKKLRPMVMHRQDVEAYKKSDYNIEQLMHTYYPTKMARKVTAEEYKADDKLSDGRKIDQMNVFKESRQDREGYGKYKLYAVVGSQKMSRVMDFKDLNAFFDRVTTPAKLVEKNFGEQLNLASAYQKYKLPEGAKVSDIMVYKDNDANRWKIKADLGAKGQTQEKLLSYDDVRSFKTTRTATREQLAAKYLNPEISSLMSKAPKQEQKQSLRI